MWCRSELVLRVWCCALLLWGVGRVAPPVEAQQRVEGVSVMRQQNQAAARTRALQDALRKALEQTVTELLTPTALLEQQPAVVSALYARPMQYIRSYRVLWEYPDVPHTLYRLGLEVEVAVGEVAQALGVGQRSRVPGQILVRMLENPPARIEPGLSAPNGGVVVHGLRTHLLAAGFRVVGATAEASWDGQERSALVAGKEAGAGVVLVGWSEVQKLRSEVAGTSLQAMQATVQVQAFATATGERLALERVQTTALHADPRLGGKQALEKAAAALAARLAPSLRTYQQRQQGQASTTHEMPLPPFPGSE